MIWDELATTDDDSLCDDYFASSRVVYNKGK